MRDQLLRALDRTAATFRGHLVAVSAGDWSRATPCTEWDVRYLVAHVVGGNRFASMILGGHTAAEALEAVMGSAQLGTDPLGDYDDSVEDQRTRFRADGALGGIVSHPLGDMPGVRFLGMRVFDVTVHAWDLAAALGRDAGLDDELVDDVLDVIQREPPGMGFGIEPCGRVGVGASPLERLLDLTGRGGGAALEAT